MYQRPLVMVECGWLFSLKAMEEVCVPKTLMTKTTRKQMRFITTSTREWTRNAETDGRSA